VSAEDQDHEVVISVRDGGVGIPKDEIPYIFDGAYRAKTGEGVARGGCGLGLAISRRIIEAHGGSIFVESELRKGSNFMIRLPTVEQRCTA
jgi:signal transduction histidine kinase